MGLGPWWAEAFGRVPRADAVLAAVVTAAALVPALVPHPQPWWAMVLTVLSSVPVLWRRVWLIQVCLVVGLAITVLELAYNPAPSEPLLLAPYGPLVCTYTFAELARPVWRTAGIVVLSVGVVVSLVVPKHNDLDVFRAVTTEFVAAYALGVGTRARRTHADAEAERTRRTAEERALAAAEERTRIARDMHDIVTHSVGLMTVQAEAGPLVVRDDPAKAEAAFEAISATGREAIGQLRVLLGTLRGDDGPGLDALPALIGRVQQAGLAVHAEETGTRRRTSATVDIAAYRVIQECLTNTVRHAGARTARLRLCWQDHALGIEVSDDGHGSAGSREGHGLTGMRERVEACGGTIAIEPRGFTVTVTLPIG
ncbi:sensor histidine kinase [Catenulispora sp. NF23]|uniref:sensor histidine kinase n=1 Tax=Catenulispora pinistramenti TaxID=2705254 RepID=UPI001BA56319|nr:sensor histidine kinase [Catenulispora pinistramenti]MBS2534763.1 sensor histidine kinase [Catenulispora pinistramenti]